MSENSMQEKCSTTGFQCSLACFSRQDGPGTFSETRVPCCSAGPRSQPCPGVLPSRDWEQCILLPLTQLYRQVSKAQDSW